MISLVLTPFDRGVLKTVSIVSSALLESSFFLFSAPEIFPLPLSEIELI